MVLIVAFRRHTLLPLDDCLYALQPIIPHLTRSALHRCLQRHGFSRLPEVAGDKPLRLKFKRYPIGYFHVDIAEVHTEEGRLGRRNWTFAGSDAGGRRAAAMYTLIETAKLNGIDPRAWLADVLARLPGHPAKQVAELLAMELVGSGPEACSMRPELRLSYRPDDDGTGRLDAAVTSGAFCGTGSAWFERQTLQDTSSKPCGRFPSPQNVHQRFRAASGAKKTDTPLSSAISGLPYALTTAVGLCSSMLT